MKNKILSVTLLLAIYVSPLLAQESSPSAFIEKIAIRDFNKLTIRSDITIMLIEDAAGDSVRVEGSREFIDKIMILQADKELVVRTKSFKDVKEKGIVYIPVNSLENIEMDADAKLVSYNTLQSPVLNILINGNCTVDIVLKGKLNIREAEGYDFTYRRVYENRKTPLVQNKNLND
ncbi:MAG TPA: DUF2807 domain-containing protein [Chitinophagaceae bacterium]|nr:DUF2807 domain-containing protein [Chitinophagaceae bacterium]